MTAQTQHWIVYAYQHANDKKFSMGYFDGTRAQATKYFNAKKNVNRYFRPGYTVTMEANPIVLHDGYETNPSLRQKGHTKVKGPNGKEITVTLYNTEIVKVLANGDIELNSGGHRTATTKRRMNEASDELNLGFNVYAKKGAWFVESHEVGTIPFFDGMVFPAVKLKNPSRRKKVVRKKRAATRNKKKVTRKKNLAPGITGPWILAAWDVNNVAYYKGPGFKRNRSEAKTYKTESAAQKAGKRVANEFHVQVAVANTATTHKQLQASLRPKK